MWRGWLIVAWIFASGAVHAEVVFEGYYRIEDGGNAVGFSVMREEFDDKSGEWTMRSFIHTLDRDHKLHEVGSISRHDRNFHPLESQYWASEGDDEVSRTQVRITVKGHEFHAISHLDGDDDEDSGNLDADEFLKPATLRVLLSNPIAKGHIYSFRSLQDDLAQGRSGRLLVLNVKELNGHKIYQLIEDSGLHKQEIWLADNGQVLAARAPGSKIIARLLPMERAMAGIKFSRNAVTKVFYEVPTGKKNWFTQQKAPLADDFFTPAGDVDTETADATPLHLPAAVSH